VGYAPGSRRGRGAGEERARAALPCE